MGRKHEPKYWPNKPKFYELWLYYEIMSKYVTEYDDYDFMKNMTEYSKYDVLWHYEPPYFRSLDIPQLIGSSPSSIPVSNKKMTNHKNPGPNNYL